MQIALTTNSIISWDIHLKGAHDTGLTKTHQLIYRHDSEISSGEYSSIADGQNKSSIFWSENPFPKIIIFITLKAALPFILQALKKVDIQVILL